MSQFIQAKTRNSASGKQSILAVYAALMSLACLAVYSAAQATPNEGEILKGRIEVMNLGSTGLQDTQSHYWAAKGAESYKAGNMDLAEQFYQKAVDEADKSKMTTDQKALLIANLATAKREKHAFDESEQLFKKALALLHTTHNVDEKLQSYITKQYAFLLRLQGRDSDADFLDLNNSWTTPTGVQAFESLRGHYAGLVLPAKLPPLAPEQLAGRVFVDERGTRKSDYVVWHRVPKGLAGSWIWSDTCIPTRKEDLLTGALSAAIMGSAKILHPLYLTEGRQVDAKGDIWDFDEYPTTEAISDPFPGTKDYLQVTYAQTASSDQSSICHICQMELVVTSTNGNVILKHDRNIELERFYVVDNGSIGVSMVQVHYDEQGRATERIDFVSSAVRREGFAKNDKYKASFCDFLRAKGLSSLIPR